MLVRHGVPHVVCPWSLHGSGMYKTCYFKLFYTVKLILRSPAVGIVCFVVHDQFVVHKVEAVGLRLIRVQDHLAHDILRQCWELVYVLACVFAAGHAEAELKVKALEQLIAKVVPLDHAEVVDGRVSYGKLHCCSDLPQL